MKKWYYWLYLSLAFAVGGIVNYLDGEQIIAAVVQVSLTMLLALIQFFCDRNGEKGRKIFKYVCMVVIVLLIICIIYLLIDTFIA